MEIELDLKNGVDLLIEAILIIINILWERRLKKKLNIIVKRILFVITFVILSGFARVLLNLDSDFISFIKMLLVMILAVVLGTVIEFFVKKLINNSEK